MWKVQVKTSTGWECVCRPNTREPYSFTTEGAAMEVMMRRFREQVRAFVFGGAEQTVRVKQLLGF